MQDYKKILIVNLSGIGDFLLSTPALRAIKKRYPEAEISALLSSKVCEIAGDRKYVDKVHCFHIGYGGFVPPGKIYANIKTLLLLRRSSFDLALNMRTLQKSSSALKVRLLRGIIKPKKTAGRDTEGRGGFYDIKIPETIPGGKYEMEYDLGLVSKLGCGVRDKRVDLAIDTESAYKVNEILKKAGVTDEDIIIGIHPGGMPSRRWGVGNFSKVIGELGRERGYKFVITGGPGEADLAGGIERESISDVINLAEALTLKELAALIKRCGLYIANDTGPMHIAAILGRPLVAIFGPGDITRFDPRNITDKAVVLYEKQECAPCEKVKCEDMRCLKVIKVEDVTKAARDLLGKKRKQENRKR